MIRPSASRYEASQPFGPLPPGATLGWMDEEGQKPWSRGGRATGCQPNEICTHAEDVEGGGGGSVCFEATRDHVTTGWGATGSGRVYLQTKWCSDVYKITYRYSRSYHVIGGVCRLTNGPSHWKVGGGVGYSSVDVRAQADFACTAGSGPTYNETVWFVLRYYANSGEPAWAAHH